MTTFIHSYSSRHVLCIDHREYEKIRDLKLILQKTKGTPVESCFLICNGAIVNDDDPVQENVVYHTYLKILGGKGGFGSMLRAIGAQIEKTTNHEACRDLSGRRMRDVNYEKDLKEWLAKKVERDREKEERCQARLARRRAMPNHKFEDPLYDKQRELLAENQEDALSKGLQKATSSTSTASTSGKRKVETVTSATVSKKRKGTEWLGIDMDMDDLGSDDDDDDHNSDDDTSDSQEELMAIGQESDDLQRHTMETGSDSIEVDGPSISIKVEPSEELIPVKLETSALEETNIPVIQEPTDSNVQTMQIKLEPSTSESASSGLATASSNSSSEHSNAVTDSMESTDKVTDVIKGEVTESVNEIKKESEAEQLRSSTEVNNDNKTAKDVEEVKEAVDTGNQDEVNPSVPKFCLNKMSSEEEVQSFGMDVLKEELMSRGLKCGGTLEQRAERLYSVKGLSKDQIDPSLFAKPNGKNGKKKK